MNFKEIYEKSKIILTEGAIVERLKAEFNLKMNNYINHAGVIYSNPEILELIYRQYADIALNHNLPIMLMTPTRRVNAMSIKESGFHNQNIIADNCRFLNKIKNSYTSYSSKILIGGQLGCKGDAYSCKNALTIEESFRFHKNQTIQYRQENIDFLFAGIMPEINEALGMAMAMAETEIPYIISFMIRNDGCLIDGTPIFKAIEMIDNQVNQKPICYMTNCVHPTNLRLALNDDLNKNKTQLKRFMGIQANASILSPEELNHSNKLHLGDFNIMIDEMLTLQKHFNLKIFGGCCGTNDKFIDDLAAKLTSIIHN